MFNASRRRLTARPPLSRRSAAWRALVCLPLILMFALSACDAPTSARYHIASGACQDYPRSYTPAATFTCYVTFASTVTYADALRIITDAGMAPTLDCWSDGDFTLWQPVGQRDLFAQWHSLIVLPNFIAPNFITGRSWIDELRYYLPGVVALHEAYRAYNARYQVIISSPTRYFISENLVPDATISYTCPPTLRGANLAPTTLTILSTNEIHYARVSFAPAISYHAALYDITNLGLRLADPCFETASVTTGYSTPDAPVDQQGQAVGFARTNALIVATAGAVSNQWQRQARGIAGATGVTVVGGSVCAQ